MRKTFKCSIYFRAEMTDTYNKMCSTLGHAQTDGWCHTVSKVTNFSCSKPPYFSSSFLKRKEIKITFLLLFAEYIILCSIITTTNYKCLCQEKKISQLTSYFVLNMKTLRAQIANMLRLVYSIYADCTILPYDLSNNSIIIGLNAKIYHRFQLFLSHFFFI